MYSPERLSTLITSLYDSVADPQLWRRFLVQMCSDLGSVAGIIVAAQCDGSPAFRVQMGIGESSDQSCLGCSFTDNILWSNNASSCVEGWIGSQAALIPDSELEESLYYREYMQPLGLYHQIGGTLKEAPGFALIAVSFFRSRHQEPFEAPEILFLQTIAPHIRQALLLHRDLCVLGMRSRVLNEIAERTNLAFVALDGKGRLQEMSDPARVILDQCDGLRIVSGELRAEAPEDDERLQLLLRGLCKPHSGRASSGKLPALGNSMLLSRRPPRNSLGLTRYPLPENKRSNETFPTAILFLGDPEAQPTSRGPVLRELFGLLPSECKLADCLLQGLDVKQAAQRLRITENSARFSLKAIFRKTGVSSQSSLMRLMLSMPGNDPATPRKSFAQAGANTIHDPA